MNYCVCICQHNVRKESVARLRMYSETNQRSAEMREE